METVLGFTNPHATIEQALQNHGTSFSIVFEREPGRFRRNLLVDVPRTVTSRVPSARGIRGTAGPAGVPAETDSAAECIVPVTPGSGQQVSAGRVSAKPCGDADRKSPAVYGAAVPDLRLRLWPWTRH